MARSDPRISLLLDLMDSAFDARGWHGTTLRGSLRGVTPAQALKRPGPGRNCVWDLVLHTAYWKYIVRRRILGETETGGFPRSPANFPAVPEHPDAAQWRRDVKLLEEEHRLLRRAVQRLDPARLSRWSPRKQWRNVEEIYGIAAHDLYHTGQIQLIKRLV